ncbi:MAG TPA: phosphoribosylanthranilate isomerase [Devosia sp.]|nr:phosphoribosylanthranilate isomerase [Devosia sp.]
MNRPEPEGRAALKIKICGIRDEETLGQTIRAGADMVGFMHFTKSPRHLEPERIAQMIARADKKTKTVVVLVNPGDGLVKTISALKPDFIQLHGNETVARVQAVRKLSGTKIIKVLPVATAEDLSDIKAFNDVADRILLDAKPPKGASRPGGLGEVFDWNLLLELDPAFEFMLSGGLSPHNVAEAVRRVGPWGIDISSGVESAPGVKDMTLVGAFINNARAAEKAKN